MKKTNARFATRYRNMEVVISEAGSDSPWVGIIRSLFKEADQLVYKVEIKDSKECIDVFATSVNWIRPLSEVKLTEISHLNFAPLRLISGQN
jgi:hypothetical protein